MRANIARLLDEFVNREDEIERFNQLLDDDTLSILVVWGDGGVGKTSLLAKMIHETAQRKMRKSEIVWTDSRRQDYLAVMRKMRDDIGVDSFQPFTDLVNYFTKNQYELNINIHGVSSLTVMEGGKIEDSEVHDVAGIIIKDLMLSDRRSDMAIPEVERMTRLTDSFISCLAEECKNEPLVVFMDAVEKMGDETQHWVWSELLEAVRDSRINNLKFVLCGRNNPQLDRNWRDIADVIPLKFLNQDYVVNYLEKRGIEEGREQLAVVLHIASEGSMLKLATLVDAYIKQVPGGVDDE